MQFIGVSREYFYSLMFTLGSTYFFNNVTGMRSTRLVFGEMMLPSNGWFLIQSGFQLMIKYLGLVISAMRSACKLPGKISIETQWSEWLSYLHWSTIRQNQLEFSSDFLLKSLKCWSSPTFFCLILQHFFFLQMRKESNHCRK